MFHISRLSTIFTSTCFIHYCLVCLWMVHGETPLPFHPKQIIAINCGSSSNSTSLDGRQWTGDAGSSFFDRDKQNGKTKSVKTVDKFLYAESVPYLTARVSYSPFSYTFGLISGPTLLRLHFYPTSYKGFTSSNAFFTVKAGPYTLLNNFSASLTADALGLKSIVKEFSLHVEENKSLHLTFSPTRTCSCCHDEFYAFVNGIELVSMPDTLYFTSEGDSGASIVGHNHRFLIGNNIALETVHRLNIGGISILSTDDTGMFREWSSDSNYLVEFGSSSVSPLTTSLKILYRKIPTFIAPPKVYQTSWEMKSGFKLSWKLPVDLGFMYLLRFHLCELDYQIKEMGQKKFSLFVNDQMVENDGDLIKWVGGHGVAMHKDYIVMMDADRMEGKHDLVIDLYSNLNPELQLEEESIDAVLKGLEVFKLSNNDKNLAGMNPVVTKKTKKSQRFVSPLSYGNTIFTIVVLPLIVLNIIIHHFHLPRENVENQVVLPYPPDEKVENQTVFECPTDEKVETRVVFQYPPDEICRRFSLAELKSATNNFDDGFVIGRGGFGKVYRGDIEGVSKVVAIKRLSSDSKQGSEEFLSEIRICSKLQHDHLVALIGYCDERNEMILVYENMPRGSLADHLYNRSNDGKSRLEPLPWDRRLKVCLDAARGLNFLHCSEPAIIHRDVKNTNILLDENWVAKISDFGLCRKIKLSHSCTHVSTAVKGTFGYLDPNYYLNGELTLKTDVYAFGVVMWEMLCGRPAIDVRFEDEQRSLVLWVQRCFEEGMIGQIIDPSLRGQIPVSSLKSISTIANECLHNHLKKRPSMADIVSCLEIAIVFLNEEKDLMVKEMNDLDDIKVPKFGSWDEANDPYSQISEVRPDAVTKPRHASERSHENIVHKIRRYFSSPVSSHDLKQENNKSNYVATQLIVYSFKDMKIATQNFDSHNLLGQGGFGTVYRGWVNEKTLQPCKAVRGISVGIKRLDHGSTQGLEEWQVEVTVLARLCHSNLVKMIGYCWDKGQKCLVYEFMENGSLDKHILKNKGAGSLLWDIRLKIAIGAAKGLAFLHASGVIMRDVKSSNILLDKNYNAKLSDFGLAKMGPSDDSSHVTTRVMGTFGYVDPEYFATGHLTKKSDVFGFGVVLLEILTGRRARDHKISIENENLVTWAMPYLGKDKEIKSILDFEVKSQRLFQGVLKAGKLTQKCLKEKSDERPSMKEVVETLEEIEKIE